MGTSYLFKDQQSVLVEPSTEFYATPVTIEHCSYLVDDGCSWLFKPSDILEIPQGQQPNPWSFDDLVDALLGVAGVRGIAQLTGMENAAVVTVTGGELSVDGGATWEAGPVGFVVDFTYVRSLPITTSLVPGTTVFADITTVNGLSDRFSARTADAVPAVPISAAINAAGTQVSVQFSEVITDGGDGPEGWYGMFTGGDVSLSYVSGLGTDTLIYAFDRVIGELEEGTVSFGQPGEGLSSLAGPVASFMGFGTANGSGVDIDGPVLLAININPAGTELTLVFDEDTLFVAQGSIDLALTSNNGAVAATYASGSGTTTLVFTLDRTVGQHESLTAQYTSPGDDLVDATGNEAALFDVEITNGSTVDQIAPIVLASLVGLNRNEISVYFSEPVTIGVDGANHFTGTFSDGAATLTYDRGAGSNVLVYSLSRNLSPEETVSLAYADPGAGIVDLAGNPLDDILDIVGSFIKPLEPRRERRHLLGRR